MRRISRAAVVLFGLLILVGIATDSASASPGLSERLTILQTSNGPLIQGLFDIGRYGAGRMISPTPDEAVLGTNGLADGLEP